jgi:hypothetical protein
MVKLKNKIQLKRDKNKSCQPELTYQTRELDYEIGINP